MQVRKASQAMIPLQTNNYMEIATTTAVITNIPNVHLHQSNPPNKDTDVVRKHPN